MEKYELQKLREVPIEGVAQRLGLQVTRHKCLCPFHDDHHASLSFSVRRNSFRCFVCGASGGTIDLVMRYLSKDFLDACRWLAEETCVQIRPPLTPPTQGENIPHGSSSGQGEDVPLLSRRGQGWSDHPQSFDPSRYERYFEHPWLNEAARRFLYEERRIDPRVVRWCKIISWSDRQGVPWLQIPYYNREGRLVGVQNRNLIKDALPRFRFPNGTKCSIYNLPVLNLLRPGEPLYIAEGCSDCWSLLSAGHKAIAIPSATLLSKNDADQLSTLNSQLSTEFHMFPDRDEPGERLFLQLQRVLPSLVHHQLPPGCKDFSEYYLASR